MKTTEKKISWLLTAVLCGIAALLLSLLDSAAPPATPEDTVTEMKDGWVFLDSDGISRPVMDMNGNIDIPAGQVTHMENTLPQDWEDGMYLCFRSAQQSVRVFVDGEQIYEYDTSGSRRFGKSTPSAWNFVLVPSGAAGKRVSIETTSPYQQSSGKLNMVFYGEFSAVELYVINQRLPQFIISIALVVLSLILFLASFCLLKSREMRHILHSLSFFILLVGVWVYGESKMPHTFMSVRLMESIAVYFALCILPIPYLEYMRCRMSPRHQKGNKVLLFAALANVLASTLLQLFQIKDLIELLPSTHAIIVLTAAYAIFAIWSDRRKGVKIGDRLEVGGFIFLVICIFVELSLFYQSQYNRTGELVPLGLLVYLTMLSISTVRALVRRSAEAAELDRKLQENRVQLLISQIQPHFIYNTLGAIQTYIKKSPDIAYKMVQDFSDYLRMNLQSLTNPGTVSFADELRHVRAYTDIELIRFQNRVQVVYEIETEDFQILPLTVQPLVENAIKHGVCKKVEGGTVWIRTQELEQEFRITVEDNGVGFDCKEGKNQQDSIGLSNIQHRLKLQMNAVVEISSVPGEGTKVTVIIPKEKKEDKFHENDSC